jgi:hypothetical protein
MTSKASLFNGNLEAKDSTKAKTLASHEAEEIARRSE